MSYANTRLSVVDAVITFGVGLLGGAIGIAACNQSDDKANAACVSGTVALAQALLASRTVSYECNP